MFGQILYTQVKWSRAAVAVLSAVAFVLPALLWRAVHQGWMRDYSALEVMRGFALLGPALGVVAFFVGFILVAQSWAADAAARHVYALSLPIPWARYVALRFGAGALLLLVPTIALWLGVMLILSLVTIPESLNAYPGTVTLRFLLAALFSYSVMFALQYLSGKRAAYVLLAAIVGVLGGSLVLGLAGYGEFVDAATDALVRWPGPLAVFASDWMLVDV